MGARCFKSSGLSSTTSTASSMSAVTNSTSKPNSSATTESVSASKRWFMVTMIPSDIHADIICVELISIMVATSPTVTNSVTLRILLSASCNASTSSDFWRWESRFSRRYLAPFDLEVFPCSFSSVSRICFWISSSVGSSLATAGRCCLLPRLLGLRFPGPVSFVIRFLRRLLLSLSAGFFGAGFLNFDKSILSPADFKPLNFLYWVSIFPEFSAVGSAGVAVFAGASALALAVGTASAGLSTAVGLSASVGFSAFSTAVSFGVGAVSLGADALGASAGFFGFGFKSILPRGFKPLKFACALTTFVGLESSGVGASSFCACSRMASFSLRFSSNTSWEASFLERSVWNAAKRSSYSCCEILAVGRASTENPFSDRWSTARSNEMFNSRSTLLIRIVFKSAI